MKVDKLGKMVLNNKDAKMPDADFKGVRGGKADCDDMELSV